MESSHAYIEIVEELHRKLGNEMKTAIQPLKDSEIGLSTVNSKLLPLESAKLNVSLAYSLSSILYVMSKCKGISVESSLMGQIKSIQDLVNQIKEAENGMDEEIRSTVINKEAIQRIVKHTLQANQYMSRNLAKKSKAS